MSPAAASFLPRWLRAALLVALCGFLPAARGQPVGTAARDSAVKAAFLYQFGSFVEWPPGTFQGPADPLVIGVLGDEPVRQDLEQLAAGRTVEGRPVRVRALGESDSPAGVHVLYVGKVRPSRRRELLAAARPVLVVTQQEGALQAGSVINFTAEGARVRFAVSLASAEARGLRLSARLLAVAQSVEGKTR